MRFLGNKRRLLESIQAAVGESWGNRPGRLVDVFAGTAVVGGHFRTLGWQVWGCDALRLSYWRQVAVLEGTPWVRFDRLGIEARDLAGVLAWLRGLDPVEGPLTRHFSPAGPAERMYLTRAHAGALDAALVRLRQWYLDAKICRVGVGLILTSLLDALSRVANISGVYAAYLKSWQPNTRQELDFRVPVVPWEQPVGRATHDDSEAFLPGHTFDVAYLDPPYNRRQYPAYYHVPEFVARWVDAQHPGLIEASLYGKTGMLPYQGSDFCRPRKVFAAFRRLLLSCAAGWVVISYSEEGLLSEAQFSELLAEFSGGAFQLETGLQRIPSQRFRSDKNRKGRQYKVVKGREDNRVHEWLFVARRAAAPSVLPRCGP